MPGGSGWQSIDLCQGTRESCAGAALLTPGICPATEPGVSSLSPAGRGADGVRPSRYNDPELRSVLPRWGQPLSFDAENGPELVAKVFGHVEVETWDEPMVSLPGPSELALFLRGRGLAEGDAGVAAQQVKTR